ncbi:MAG: hypothetical protein LUQ24_06035 [Methanobacterium sp.]|nr:hypothetical protein [Methanobacterium sp.]
MKYNNVLKILFLITPIIFLACTASASVVYFNATTPDKYVVYQKPTDSKHWNEYTLYRTENSAINQDVYQIHKLYNIDLSKSNPGIKGVSILKKTTLTNGGNWEKALKIQTSQGNIYIGGGHGFEVLVSQKCYKDNKQFIPVTGKIVTAEDLKIVIKSNLLDPENPKNVIANIITSYLWNGVSLKINSQYLWKKDITVLTAYASMFPVSNIEEVSSIGQLYGGHYQSLKSGEVPVRLCSPGGVFLNKKNDLRMSMRVSDPEHSLFNYAYAGNTRTYFKVEESYNKLYVTLISSPSYLKVYNGMVWCITAEYRVWNQCLRN